MLFVLAIVNFILSLACVAIYIFKFRKCNRNRCLEHSNDNPCSLYIVLIVTAIILTVWYGFVIFMGSEFAPIVARLNTTLLLINALILNHV